ncbi:hypothetical protein NKK48_00610 [Mesorhizobium sp. C386A]|uniref:hypothetical protein n=1 Tax=Mesorhizobium sp. C386A TaxID=2956831 RepID=UPI00333D0433
MNSPVIRLETPTRRVDPFLMSVLKSRFEAVAREMTLGRDAGQPLGGDQERPRPELLRS